MAVVKDARSPFFRFDFQMARSSLFRLDQATTRREAEAVERVEREKAKRHLAQARAAAHVAEARRRRRPLLVGSRPASCGRRQYRAAARLSDRVFRQGQADHRHHRRRRRAARRLAARSSRAQGGPLISPFTVNDTTEQLKKLFTRAKAGACVSTTSRNGASIG